MSKRRKFISMADCNGTLVALDQAGIVWELYVDQKYVGGRWEPWEYWKPITSERVNANANI